MLIVGLLDLIAAKENEVGAMKKLLVKSIACCLGLFLLGTDLAFSQGIEEIIVTARKRTESAQETPVAVTAFSGETIRKMDLTTIEKFADMSPEFTVGRGATGSGAELRLRGIGSNSSSIGIEQSVAVVLDDVYFGQGRFINEGLFDLQHVELLKGPQALFYGKNATAGVLSLKTADPGAEFEASAKLAYEFEGQQSVGEVVLSGPVSDTVGMRFAMHYGRSDGPLFKNIADPVPYNTFDVATGVVTPHTAEPAVKDEPGLREYTGRFTLTADPNEKLSLKFKVSASKYENNNNTYNYIIYNGPFGYEQNNPNFPVGPHYVVTNNNIPTDIAPYVFKAGNGDLGDEYKSHQETFTLGYQFDRLSLTSVTNYQHYTNLFICDCDYEAASNNKGTWATEDQKWDAFSEELRLLSQFDSPVNFMIGALYQKTNRDYFIDILTSALENSAVPSHRYTAMLKDSKTDGETFSPFFQVIWNPVDTVEITAGARYTHETKDSEFVHPYVNPALAGLWREGQVVKANQKFTKWSPEVTVRWNTSENIMLYAGYKSGYKSGGFSNSGIYSWAGAASDFTFSPETAKGFEAGIKSTVLENQLRLNVTAYSYEFEGLQVDFLNAPTFAFITFNAGKAETKGIEVEAEYVPSSLPNLHLTGNLNYNKAEYKQFIAPCLAGQKPSEGCTEIVPGTVGTPGQDISGKPTAVSPEWTAAFGIDYDFDLSNGMVLGLTGNAQYIDSYIMSGYGDENSRLGDYTRFDAGIRLTVPDSGWELALLGKNLTNEFIGEGSGDVPSTGSGTGTEAGIRADVRVNAANPRTVWLQLLKRW